MNAFVKKEVRLLLPTFLAALVLAFSTVFLSDADNYYSGLRAAIMILPFILSPALVLMMTLHSFGSEISAGTFSNLLAQPISRREIWRTKTILLATAILIVWMVWWLSFAFNQGFRRNPRNCTKHSSQQFLFQWRFFPADFGAFFCCGKSLLHFGSR